MIKFAKWMTLGLAVTMAGWTVSANANDRRARVGLDRRENVRDRNEDVRDRREDVRDRANGNNGPLDRAEDVRDRREDVRDRREDARDRLNPPGTPAQREQARENVVDRRDVRQDKRIEHGINKGYLTADEAKKLQDQQAAIDAMASSFKGDGKLTPSEFRQLQGAFNEASRCIWAEKHDTDGNQMPVYRLGKDVRANADLTSKLADPNLTKPEARALAREFHLMLGIKHRLATADLSAEQRAKLQAEYNEMLNKYFTLAQ
ncbi:MAG TPA: hypothetical protein PK280_10905 [Planctomycetota bacterium]|nr:hypothetical protein [Planctomycetota bacterium]